ncbi:MAG: hypothetical protein J0H63_11670, partial [Rhizobiales bacterium]|nr:hypothetical protein [Hyphomicrobiales bacterium]
MAVTALLAVALAAVIILFFLGVFDRKTPTPAVAAATPVAAAPTPVAAAPSGEGEAQPLDPSGNPPTSQVQKAVVSAAPPAPGEPPIKDTHGDWHTRCDKP